MGTLMPPRAASTTAPNRHVRAPRLRAARVHLSVSPVVRRVVGMLPHLIVPHGTRTHHSCPILVAGVLSSSEGRRQPVDLAFRCAPQSKVCLKAALARGQPWFGAQYAPPPCVACSVPENALLSDDGVCPPPRFGRCVPLAHMPPGRHRTKPKRRAPSRFSPVAVPIGDMYLQANATGRFLKRKREAACYIYAVRLWTSVSWNQWNLDLELGRIRAL